MNFPINDFIGSYMKISNFIKEDILTRIEQVTKKVGKTTGQLNQTPQLIAEQLRQKGSELFSILSPLFRARARTVRPEFLRGQIRKRVKKHLVGLFQEEEIIEVVTDCLVKAAKEDPYYRELLGLEEKLV